MSFVRLIDYILCSSNIYSFLRPFLTKHEENVSQDNCIVDSYIFDWDNNISSNNHIVDAQLDFRPPNLKGDKI